MKADTRLAHQQGQTGVVVIKTNQALLVGHYPEGVQAGTAVETMEQVAKHLRNAGY